MARSLADVRLAALMLDGLRLPPTTGTAVMFGTS